MAPGNCVVKSTAEEDWGAGARATQIRQDPLAAAQLLYAHLCEAARLLAVAESPNRSYWQEVGQLAGVVAAQARRAVQALSPPETEKRGRVVKPEEAKRKALRRATYHHGRLHVGRREGEQLEKALKGEGD